MGKRTLAMGFEGSANKARPSLSSFSSSTFNPPSRLTLTT